jgi:dynein regulatory complex protein 1
MSEEKNVFRIGLTLLQDILNNLKSRLTKQEKQFASDHAALQEDYNRISSQYDELTKKFKHFQLNDEVKFQELWEMNQEHIKDLVAKVLKADSVIYQQQLGLPWEAPKAAQRLGVDGSKLVPQANAEVRPQDSPVEGPEGLVKSIEQEPLESHLGKEHMEEDDHADRKKTASLSSLLLGTKNDVIQRILCMLSTEANFLLDDKLCRLLAPLPEQERELLKIDTILKALDVTSTKDLEKLLELFLQPKYQSNLASLVSLVIRSTHASQEKLFEPVDENMLIHPNQLTEILGKFLQNRENRERDRFNEDKSRKQADKNISGKRPSTSKDLQAHWNEIIELLESDRFKNWDYVLKCMEEYHLLLASRKDLAVEVFHSLTYYRTPKLNILTESHPIGYGIRNSKYGVEDLTPRIHGFRHQR